LNRSVTLVHCFMAAFGVYNKFVMFTSFSLRRAVRGQNCFGLPPAEAES
jgi:hypothetical protein